MWKKETQTNSLQHNKQTKDNTHIKPTTPDHTPFGTSFSFGPRVRGPPVPFSHLFQWDGEKAGHWIEAYESAKRGLDHLYSQ